MSGEIVEKVVRERVGEPGSEIVNRVKLVLKPRAAAD